MNTKTDFSNRSCKSPNMVKAAQQIIITRIGLVAFLVAGVGFTAVSQSFFNFDFEQASLIPLSGDPYGGVQFGPALRGWTGYCGTDVQTAANYNNEFLDSAGISILDTNYTDAPVVGLTHGRYCVLLQTGLRLNDPSSGFVAAAIAQTGTVPANAETVIFNAGLISSANLTNLVVTFNGTPLLLAVITTYPNYAVIGGDVSQFAGQSGELRFTAPILRLPPDPYPYPFWNSVLLDNIGFSSAPLPAPPIIRASPQSQGAVVGATVDFVVTVAGSPPLTYQWFLNQTNALGGATNSTLELVNVQLTQAGAYTVVVRNLFGAVSSDPALLTVSASPALLTAPVNQTAVVGDTVDFAVTAAGSPPLAYQWFFNRTNALDGAIHSILELINVQPEQAGAYTVVVTNAFGAVTSAPAPLTVIASPAASTVVAWGEASDGELGVPVGLSNVLAVAAGGNHSLALKSDGTVVAWGNNGYGQTNLPTGLSNVLAIAAGSFHSLALQSHGTVIAWGYNNWGQTGVPAGLTNVIAIAAGDSHSLALKSDGMVVAWGYNGNGTSTTPAGLRDVTAMATGGEHSLALRSDGSVVAWGNNASRQTNVPAGLRRAIAIAGGGGHSLAVQSDGTVVAWGDNSYGQTNVPAGLRNVIAVAAGFFHSLALRADGTVIGWGFDNYGQTKVPSGLRSVIAIAAGSYHSLALVGVTPAIRIVPISQTAEIGTSAAFTVHAPGDPPMTYQWFFNGTNVLSGATADPCLHLTEVRLAQAGAYTVLVSNALGVVTSAPAMLSVIPAVERRMVPALTFMGQPGSSLNLQDADALGPSPSWVTFDNVALTNTSQWYFDLSTPLPPQRFYRARQPDPSSVAPSLDLHMVPALILAGTVGSAVRVDYINQFGPTDAWVTLATVTLTNTSQLYFDISTIGQPPRLWGLMPMP